MSSLNPNYRITIMQSTPPGLAGAGQGIIVEAPMPETLTFDVQSAYATALPQGLTSGPVATGAAMLGLRLAVPALTAQLWQGSSEIQLTLALEFHTENDPVADVQIPILNLNRLVMPSVSSATGLLQSPGPVIDYTQLGTIAKNAGQQLGNTVSNIKNKQVTPVPASMNNTSISTNDAANNSQTAPALQNPTLGTSQYWKTKIANQISIRIGNYMYFDSVVITNVQQTFMSSIDAITGLPHHATINVTFKPLFMITQEDLNGIFINNTSSAGLPTSNNLGSSFPTLT
jgi:hypothetical protein